MQKTEPTGAAGEFVQAINHSLQEIAFGRWGAIQMTQNLEGLGFIIVFVMMQGLKTRGIVKLSLKTILSLPD